MFRFLKIPFGWGIDTPPDQLHAYVVGGVYPPQELVDSLSIDSNPVTAFVVTAGCSASAFWAALSTVLNDRPREVIQQIHLAVIHDIAEMYKEENQLELSV